MIVRTRIALSPTGDPHIGSAYVALCNVCFAAAQGGDCILRIEDTDEQRSSKESEQNILTALRWLGLKWQEGPDVGGAFGPYRQSERTALHQKEVATLLAKNCAFRCFCSPARLDELRKSQRAEQRTQGYDGACLKLSAADVQAMLDAGKPHVVRMRIPASGSCLIPDGLRGAVSIDWQQIDMQVLLKTDGTPTYHLANVVDDHLMQITHVIRGEEWINSTPKHLKLYEDFGWQAPAFYHLPLLRNPDKSKISKRKNPTSIHYYRDKGILPEALLNYLALLGWSMPDGKEIFDLDEMIGLFDINRVNLGGAIFDIEKLRWVSGQWLRKLPQDIFAQRFTEWLPDKARIKLLLPLIQKRVESFDQVLPQLDYLLGDIAAPPAEALHNAQLGLVDSKRVLQFALWQLENANFSQPDALQRGLTWLAEAMRLQLKVFLRPLFVAISGKEVSLPLFASLSFVGKDIAMMRLKTALSALGGFSKKERKTLEKDWQMLATAAAPLDNKRGSP